MESTLLCTDLSQSWLRYSAILVHPRRAIFQDMYKKLYWLERRVERINTYEVKGKSALSSLQTVALT